MSDIALLLKSIAIGIAVAAPVGPMSLLCIERTIHHRQLAGMIFGAGVAFADASYAAIAAFGITAVTSFLLSANVAIKLVGGLLLIYLGIKIAYTNPAASATRADGASGWKAFAVAYGLTITNPPTILYFVSIFASLSEFSSSVSAAIFTLGVLLGSLFWWAFLTTIVSKGANWLTPRVRTVINRLSGAVLIAFALYGLWTVLRTTVFPLALPSLGIRP